MAQRMEDGMRNGRAVFEPEGGVKTGAPMPNGCSDTSASLSLEYPHLDTSNDTKTTAA